MEATGAVMERTDHLIQAERGMQEEHAVQAEFENPVLRWEFEEDVGKDLTREIARVERGLVSSVGVWKRQLLLSTRS